MKIKTRASKTGAAQPQPTLYQQTYIEAKSAHEKARQVLDLLEAPSESEDDDPLALLMEQLVKLEVRLMRIERRLGIGDRDSSQQPD